MSMKEKTLFQIRGVPVKTAALFRTYCTVKNISFADFFVYLIDLYKEEMLKEIECSIKEFK